ncbi:MAG: glycosyltransferase family 4 protein [Bacteroidales bacterium]|nr:glycosyltransferase family 4 protein [Bacteroidales bacterium]
MKVVYVLHCTTGASGATKSFRNMLDGLIANGIEPLVVLPDGDDFCKTLQNEGIRTLILNYRPATYPPLRNLKEVALFIPKLIARIFVNNVAARKLCKEAKDFEADFIHTNVSVINIGMKAARRLGIPHVTHIREYGDKDFNMHVFPSKSIYFKNFSAEKSYTICITKDISKYYNLDNHINSRIIYNGILHASDVIIDPQKEDYFLFAGRLEESKGITNLIEAYGKLYCERKDAFPLLVAGEPVKKEYGDMLHEMAASLGIADKVKFLGNRDDIFKLMSKASALIVPSRSEAFGRVTTEAMFAGCLVIGKDIAGTKEQFDNGLELTGNEIGLRYSDSAQLARLMCEVMDNGPEFYLPMIKKAQETVTSLYTIEQNTAHVYEFYKDIKNEI